jgi:hypothetical protein
LEEQDVGGWTILKWILDKIGWYGLDRSRSGEGPVEMALVNVVMYLLII